MGEDEKREKEARKPPYDYAGHFAHVRNVADLLRDPDEQAWTSSMPASPEHRQYVVWLGCNAIRTAHIAETLTDILTHAGADFVALGGPNHCCGAVHRGQGANAIGDNMLRQTMKRFDAFTPDRMLNWCPSCDTQLRAVPNETLTPTVRNRETVTTFLSDILKPELFKVSVPLTVALHVHGGTPSECDDGAAARAILSRIPGLKIVDSPAVTEIPRHCSDASVRKLGEAAYRQLLDGWIRDAKAAGADRLVSIYHSCHRQLALMQRDLPGDGIEIVNYLSLIARSLGLPEREDRFGRFARSGDIDAIMEEVAPNIDKLGIDRERARAVLTRQFGKR